MSLAIGDACKVPENGGVRRINSEYSDEQTLRELRNECQQATRVI
jgi:hypothetical protein